MKINKKIYDTILSNYEELILGKHLSEAWINDQSMYCLLYLDISLLVNF